MRIYIKPVTSFKGMDMESQLLASSSASSVGNAVSSPSYNEYPVKFGDPTGSAD